MNEKLASDGGSPVRETFLPYGHQWIDEDDIEAVVQVLLSGWVTTGPKVEEFEAKLAEWTGARYAVAVSSGTAALHAAVFAAQIGPGDEVITTPMTFAATANCVLYQGGTPVFADVQPDTLNIDPEEIERRITPRTRALITMDFGGHPCDIDEIRHVARRRGLMVIEDAAHALGASYRGKRIGSLSDMTVFSFHPVKAITTGEGGAVTTDDPALAQRLRMFRNHGITSEAREREGMGAWFYEMVELGYNYRLTDIQCALGLAQLGKLERFLSRRRDIANRYGRAFARIPGLSTISVRSDRECAWHIYPILLDLQKLQTTRDRVFTALRAENIGVNVHYIPVHLHPYYRRRFGYKGGDYPVAEDAYERILTLPIFPKASDQDIDSVIQGVKKVLAHYCNLVA